MGLIWYFIARRANNIFRWIYAVLAFVGIGLYGWGVIVSAFEFEFLDDATVRYVRVRICPRRRCQFSVCGCGNLPLFETVGYLV